MRCALSAASSYSVSENGAMPPVWWHVMQCAETIGATSLYQVARAAVRGGTVSVSASVPHPAVATTNTAKKAARMAWARAMPVPAANVGSGHSCGVYRHLIAVTGLARTDAGALVHDHAGVEE